MPGFAEAIYGEFVSHKQAEQKYRDAQAKNHNFQVGQGALALLCDGRSI